VHSDVWDKVRPTTSANAHLLLKAAAIVDSQEHAQRFASQLRRAFFIEGTDISKLETLYQLAHSHGYSVDELRSVVEDGRAIAALLGDNKRANDRRVQGSPTWLLNSGRQVLYGNVGYRVLQANVEELLHRPAHQASWC
jgi:predicted DsbA family dithiol-disulfide isomerase